MRVAFAGFHLESASWLPQISTLEDFERNTTRGEDIVTAYEGTNTVPGGFINVCRGKNYDIVPLVYGYLGALGPASDEAVEAYASEIATSTAASNVDAILLHLHGATWAPTFTDPERYILDRLRELVGKNLPIVVAFDYHGNIDQDTVRSVNAAFAYQKSPHTDMAETGARAARCLSAILEGILSPAVVVEKPGLAIPSIFSATSLEPLASILAYARELEREAACFLDISIMAGFSYSDAHNTGFSVVVVSGASLDHGRNIALSLSDLINARRAQLYHPEPVFSVQEAVVTAMVEASSVRKPIILLEHADRMNDSTYLLSELVKRDAQRTAIPFLWDSKAAMEAHGAGVGAEIQLMLGAWSSDKAGSRERYLCQVLQTGPIRYRISGEMLRGQHVNLGMTAVLRIGGVTVSVVSNFAFTVDEDIFKVFGQKMSDFDIIVLRSKTHFRQFFEEKSSRIIIVDTPDYGPADLTTLTYKRLDTSKVYPFCETYAI
ncbi:M81 family metallopeptidase [Limibacillus sp. MBR-115]|jgi:microcystin degradation protein MlrC|uniref:M81 family metallopeptidase n=1 Tax=Limibacillus sp. MBR-115 TaxID=3156465 RepID=UPI0033934DD7